MTQRTDLNLIPEQEKLSNRTFQNQVEFDGFWDELMESVRPELERFAEARRSSEEDAKRRWLA